MRRLLAITLGVAAALAAAAPSHAAEPKRPSAGLRAYGLDWLQYVRARDIPATRYAVCIVDNGVAVTPDTPPDDPNGPILKRLSIDGGSGEPQGTAPEFLHGTRMAMAAVAPRNGWGMVGMFPQGRVVSVRASVEGEAGFRVAGYSRGIDECLQEALTTPVAVINLSLGCGDCQPSAEQAQRFQERVARAAAMDIPVVVSAGNTPGPLVFPASVSGSVVIGAGGNRGRRCKSSAWSETAFALAPACPVAGAEPLTGALEPSQDGGTSTAAAEVSTIVAAFRQLRPDQTSSTVLSWLAQSRRTGLGGPRVDGRGAAKAAALAGVLRRADRLRRRSER